ncbi:MAG: T9SS type A sorting domain-containing protein [Melioribacteraceae bacterium]
MPILKIYKWTLIVFLFLFISSLSFQTNGQTNSKVYSKFNINRISTYIYNDGIADIQQNGNTGFEFPKGSSKGANYCGGFIWGGKIDGAINVGGAAYRAGLSPGKILSNGKAADPGSDNSRVFRVRRDYKTADLNIEAEDEDKTAIVIYDQYEKDWKQWPATDGAPYEDVNKNGVYEPSIDIPGIPGANQTLWFVSNDLDSNRTRYFSGTLPIGIEMQVTVWGYKYDGTYRGDALFKRYVIINKSQKEIKEMYFGIWADPDVGDAGDDLVGCDSTLNMVYMFGSKASDATYGSNSPAFGYSLLQGPIVDGLAGDKAIFKNKIVIGKKNLQMSALGWMFKNVMEWSDPTLGVATTASQLYNFLMGKSRSGLDWQIPARLGGGITKFPFSGDYVRKTGYYDGVENVPMDRRMMLCVGPFNMAAGDTQEVVFLESAAGADRIANNLDAIDMLKANVLSAKKNYSTEYKHFTNPNELKVNVINDDKLVILDWGWSLVQINKIEKEEYEVKFQGYNVYQFPDSNYVKTKAKSIALYDKHDSLLRFQSLDFDKLKESNPTTSFLIANDSGIKRYLLISYDKLNNANLANWRDYFFGVSYFSHATNGKDNFYYESDIYRCKAFPGPLADGYKYSVTPGYSLNLSHVAGTNNDNYFNVFAVDPSKFGDYDYEMTFRKVNNEIKLNLKNRTTGKIIFNSEPISYYDQYPMFDGLALEIRYYGGNNRPLTESDIYQFSTKTSVFDKALVVDDLKKINVFPNPFYGLNKMDTQNTDKFVTFTHLPQRAVIKIFNIAGQIVRTIEKDSPGKTLQWDLSNNNGFIVAGGMYVALVELPEFGKTKVLKLIVVPSSSLPQFF